MGPAAFAANALVLGNSHEAGQAAVPCIFGVWSTLRPASERSQTR